VEPIGDRTLVIIRAHQRLKALCRELTDSIDRVVLAAHSVDQLTADIVDAKIASNPIASAAAGVRHRMSVWHYWSGALDAAVRCASIIATLEGDSPLSPDSVGLGLSGEDTRRLQALIAASRYLLALHDPTMLSRSNPLFPRGMIG
jgi:hypothetical protein